MVKRRIKVMSDSHVRDALAAHLRALSILDDDETVVKFKRVPEGLEVNIEKEDK